MIKHLRFLVTFAIVFFFSFAFAQTNISGSGCLGIPGACGYHSTNSSNVSRSGPNQTPQNGNGTLGNIYNNTACGLNYSSASQRLGKRFSPAGINQPAPFVISGIPSCAIILKAYLWAEGSGNGAAQTANINGPCGVAGYPMAVVGSGPDKCWGYSGSYTYRADVTPSVCGNGTYNISGILTNPPTPGNDMDGATLLVVWRDPTQLYSGTLIIDDGAIVINGGSTTYNMNYPAVCGATTNAVAFCGLGDIQMAVSSLDLNFTADPIVWNWWNFEQVNTTVAAGQTTSPFFISTPSDCYNLCIAGLYYRTTCTVCTPSSSITLTTSTTPASCSACNGSATVSVTPAGPYTYLWSPSGQTTSTATNLCAGTYTVTVTAACGTGTAVVTVPTSGGGITVTNTGQTNVSCNGQCNGSATVTPSGGTLPYTYAWMPSGGTNPTAPNLCAGNYTCTVTDAAGCTGTQSFAITQPPLLTATSSFVGATCGNSNGSATVTPAGGTPGYGYSWSPIAGSTPTLPNIPQGTYTCVITDALGCTTTVTVTVPNASGPAATLASFTNVSCFNACDGTANVTVAGGAPPITYNWLPSGGNSANATGLCPGTYTCTTTDANSCTSTATVTITQPTALAVTAAQANVTCFGACNGSATVTVTGGTAPYTYNWLPSGGTGPSAPALCAGTYTCTATDANGCVITQQVTITEPPILTLTSAGFNVSCFGVCDGQVVVIPAGGTSPYSFSWNTGCTAASCSNVCAGTYNVTVTDLNGCTATSTATVTEPPAIIITTSEIDAHCGQSDGSATATFSGGTGGLTPVWYNPQQATGSTYSNIPPGNYFVVVTDANGCDDTAQATVNNIPGVIASLGQVSNVSCFGGNNGSITVLDNGVNTPYSYSWSCSPSTTNTAPNLSAGNCTVTLTDATGCTSSVTATVTQPTQLTLTVTANPPSVCNGQPVSLSATAGGGTPGYQYVWMPGILPGQNQNIVPVATQTYSVYITDVNNCVDSANVLVTVNPIPVAGLSGDSLQGCVPLCVNFSDLSTLASGTINQWSWNFGDANTSTQQNPTHCYITAGVYTITLTVSSTSGCANTITMTNYVNVFTNPIADFSASPQPTTELDATIYFTDQSINATTWSWSFGDTTNASSLLQNPSYTYGGSGCYPVVLSVSTPNGCVDTTMHVVCIDPDVTIYVPNAFTPNADGINDIFFAQGIGLDPEKFQMWVFDRWGNLIFTSTDINKGWNGCVQGHSDICQEDVYVWKIKAVDVLGKKHSLIGHVSLIR
ncbi:MAG: gliding motility-associated C-terminal domain-containing protein [Bacteroidetes bacterium]|nr:gliding motility-associated C-terminal domain-containing protein [Bacteroidota bacterium]